MQLLYVSDLTVNPDHWNPKKEEIKAKALVHPTEKAEMNKLVCPEERTLDDGGEFFKAFDHFLSVHKLSDVRIRNYRVIYRALQRFELYRRINVSKKFRLTFDAVTPDILREFETFLRKEHTFFTRDDETGKFTCSPKYKPVYDAFPETRTPQARGQNTINDVFTKLRTFFRWAVD